MLKDEVLDKTIPVPLYFQLKTLIKNKIKDGTYKSGDLIPTENELSDMFGISRTTVRQAVTEMVHEGYLYRIKSKGTFVAKKKITQQVMNQYYSYDRAVQATGGNGQRIQIVKEVIPMPQEMIDLGAGVQGDKVIYLYRKNLFDGIPVVRSEAYLVYNKFADLMDKDLVNNSLREIMDSKPETRVYRLRRFIEAIPATKEDINVLDVEPGSAIQKMTTIRYNEEGEILDMAYSYHRGDFNRVELEIINPSKDS